MTTYEIKPQGGRWSAQMNKAVKLGKTLTWNEATKTYFTTSSEAVAEMRRLGAAITEVEG